MNGTTEVTTVENSDRTLLGPGQGRLKVQHGMGAGPRAVAPPPPKKKKIYVGRRARMGGDTPPPL